MKLNKKLSLMAVLVLFLGLTLTACSGENGEPTEEPDATEEGDVAEADVISNPTSARGTTAGEMIASLSPEGAWVFGLGADITLEEGEGELNINGDVLKHSGGAWTDEYERKVGLYQRDEDRVPTGTFTLTVAEGINVNSPNTFFISDGPFVAEVNADVFVNTENFRLNGVQINGDVVFASQELLDSAVAFIWDSEAAETNDNGDYVSNSGWVPTDFASFVTGEVRVAE